MHRNHDAQISGKNTYSIIHRPIWTHVDILPYRFGRAITISKGTLTIYFLVYLLINKVF